MPKTKVKEEPKTTDDGDILVETKMVDGEEIKVVGGIELTSDFPSTRRSADPVKAVKALLEHGTWVDAAKELVFSDRALRAWRKYPEIEKAYQQGSDTLGYEAEQTMVTIMRGESPGEDQKPPRAKTSLSAAKRLVEVNHPTKDYSQRKRRFIQKQKDGDAIKEELKDADMDDLLDIYNSMKDE